MLSNESLKQTPVEIAIIIFMYLHIKRKVWSSIGTERRTDRGKRKGKRKRKTSKARLEPKRIGNRKSNGFKNFVGIRGGLELHTGYYLNEKLQ